jgi:hypothetical protein
VDHLDYQRAQDREHLRLLALFSRIFAGLLFALSCCFLAYPFMGAMMLTGTIEASPKNGRESEAFGGAMFIVVGLVFLAIYGGLATANLIAAKRFEERQGHTFLFVISCLNCLFAPIGTGLGVFSLVVLSRPTVKELFGIPVPGMPPTQPDVPASNSRPPFADQQDESSP